MAVGPGLVTLAGFAMMGMMRGKKGVVQVLLDGGRHHHERHAREIVSLKVIFRMTCVLGACSADHDEGHASSRQCD